MAIETTHEITTMGEVPIHVAAYAEEGWQVLQVNHANVFDDEAAQGEAIIFFARKILPISAEGETDENPVI